MACVVPPELDERTLLRYLDGAADQRVVVHLEQCPYCRERARSLAHLQARLTAGLYRAACPSPLELGEYHLGALPRQQAAAVSRHLAECPHCSREVAQLKGYLGELAPELESSAVERIKVLVAQLMSAAGEGGRLAGATLAPAYVGVRGEEAGPRLYQAGEAQIAINVQLDSKQPDRKTILGLITGIETTALQVDLFRAGDPVAHVAVDELGNFVVAGLAPATYELTISGSEAEIHIQELDVGAS